MKWFTLFHSVDLLAKEPTLNISGQSGVKSVLGGGISICMLAAIVFVIYNAVSEYLDTTAPTVVQISSYLKLFPELDLIENKVFPVLYGYYGANETRIPTKEMEKFVTISMDAYNYEERVGADGKNEIGFKSLERKGSIPCKDVGEEGLKLLDGLNPSPANSESIRSQGICLPYDRDFMKVYGNFGNTARYLYYRIAPCSLESGCASLEEFRNIYFALALPQASFDPSDHENPVKFSVSGAEIILPSVEAGQWINAKFRREKIFDEGGILSPEKKRQEFVGISTLQFKTAVRIGGQVKCTKEAAENPLDPSCSPYLTIEFKATGETITHKRKYKGILEQMAEVGGLKEIINLMCLLIYLPFANRLFRLSVLPKIFPFIKDGKNSNDPNKQKGGIIRRVARRHTSPLEGQDPQPAEKKPIWKRMCLCCRRKEKGDEEEDNFKRMEKASLEVVENTLDLVELVKNMNRLRVLTSIFLKGYHYLLIPVMALNLQLKSDRDKSFLKKKKQRSDSRMSSINSGVSEFKSQKSNLGVEASEKTHNYEAALEMLKDSIANREAMNQMDRNQEQNNVLQRTVTEIFGVSKPRGPNSVGAEDGIHEMVDNYCMKSISDSYVTDWNAIIHTFKDLLSQKISHIDIATPQPETSTPNPEPDSSTFKSKESLEIDRINRKLATAWEESSPIPTDSHKNEEQSDGVSRENFGERNLFRNKPK